MIKFDFDRYYINENQRMSLPDCTCGEKLDK